MKHWGKITGAIFAMLLAFTCLQAQAASKADREFNHMSTGFPLTGVHATTPCETCHSGGIFVGTPRACDGCHATGKRVVATPKSTKHLVTDAPCETCHFNTSTFFGARFNHGTAMPGQCDNCHNGRIVQGKPTNHPVTIHPCDSCHRSIAWIPASWNHTDTASDCSVCHQAAGPGRPYTSARHGSYNTLGILATCKECHTNYYTFSSYYYRHNGPGAVSTCGTCHNAPAYANGVMQIATTTAHTNYGLAGIACTSCHKSYGIGMFAAGRYDHASGATCDTCHSGHAVWAPAITQISAARTVAHGVYAAVGITTCTQCHKSTAAWAGSGYDHVGAGACVTCHTAANSPSIRAMAANHIPIALTATCESCHISKTNWASVSMQHNATQIALTPCTTCHLRGNTYIGGMNKQNLHHVNAGQTDCSAGGCHAPAGTRGTAYRRWTN